MARYPSWRLFLFTVGSQLAMPIHEGSLGVYHQGVGRLDLVSKFSSTVMRLQARCSQVKPW